MLVLRDMKLLVAGATIAAFERGGDLTISIDGLPEATQRELTGLLLQSIKLVISPIGDAERAVIDSLEEQVAASFTNEAEAEKRADAAEAAAEEAREQLDALEKDLASFSAELGLPPKIRPAEGELRKLRDAAAEAQRWKETFEMYRNAWRRELGGTLPNKTHDIDAFALATENLRKERDRLLGFKSYVHRRLDVAGIENTPKGPHADAGCRIGQRLDVVFQKLDDARTETERVKAAIAKPEIFDFYKGLVDEAAHQRVRWAATDENKSDAEWFWLVGYLASKALHFPEKRLHHLITAAAALFNWHLATLGKTDMRPGIAAPVESRP